MAEDPRFYCKLTRKLAPIVVKKRSYTGIVSDEDMKIVEDWFKTRSWDNIIEEEDPFPFAELYQKAAEAKGKDSLNIVEMMHMNRAYHRFTMGIFKEAASKCIRYAEEE